MPSLWKPTIVIAIFIALLLLHATGQVSARSCTSPAIFEAQLEFAPKYSISQHSASSHLGKQLVELYIHQQQPRYPGLFTVFTNEIRLYLFSDRSLITYIHQGRHSQECLLGYLGLSHNQLLWFLNSIDNNI